MVALRRTRRAEAWSIAAVLTFGSLGMADNATAAAWDEHLRTGDLATAVDEIRQALAQGPAGTTSTETNGKRLKLAKALADLGRTRDAIPLYSDVIGSAGSVAVPAIAWCGRAWAHVHRGNVREAEADAETCRQRTRDMQSDPKAEAEAAGMIALLHRLHGRNEAAHAELVAALNQALVADDPEFAAELLQNLVAADPATNEAPVALLQQIADRLGAHAPHFDVFRADLALAHAAHGRAIHDATPDAERKALDALAETVLLRAEALAAALGNDRATAVALGRQALLHETRGNADRAHELAARALDAKHGDPGLAHDLHRQRARALRDDEDGRDDAIDAYYKAVDALKAHDPDAAVHDHAKRHLQGDPTALTFKELAGLLLERADEEDSPHATHQEALEVLERKRQAELHAHLLSDEPPEKESDAATIAAALNSTALLHAMLLEDRFEWLITLPSGTERVTVPVPEAELTALLHRFRDLVQDRTRFALRDPARRLYDLLVQPILPMLEQDAVHTLILVPDGALRSIPFGALMSGPKRFLIQDYAVATIPGLRLVELEPFAFEEPTLLAVGLTESVQGYDALPYAGAELAALKDLFPGAVLQDTAFTEDALRPALSRNPFDILHIASHADFGHPAGMSYILTHDDHMRLKELESMVWASGFREDPIEMLTLSACRTAAGDADAPLGLAGIAFRAGAKSVLGTLWFVNDEASSQVVTGFYRELASGQGLTRAEALRRAQRAVMQERRFRHPYYWAAFTIVGNWL